MEFQHKPVMLSECIEGLNIKPDGIYVDGTAGGAGHSIAIAKSLKAGMLIAFDRDPDAVKIATERLKSYKTALVINANFSDVESELSKLNINMINGILLDLGVSSYQLDNADRGFSYNSDARLDMRMSQSGISAEDIVNTYSLNQLTKILRDFGEEKFAYNISKNIISIRENERIKTTQQLADIIKSSIPAAARREGGNPCKRTFQGIRIAVNSELESLSAGLDAAFELLSTGGRMAVITFHSLEDRIVKLRFLEWAKGCTCPPDFPICVCNNKPRGRIITKKPILPSLQEISENSRSKSAKLRIIEKL